jgi:hypothetical protein
MGTHNSGQKIPKDDRDAFWYIPWTFKFYYCSNHSNDSKDDRDAFWYILWTPYSMVASGVVQKFVFFAFGNLEKTLDTWF